jgi:DNA-binding MarR family transcriptional regulator
MRNPGSHDFPLFASLRLETLARQSRRYADLDYRRKIGFGVLQCRMIAVVGAQGPIKFRELCRRVDVEKSQASRLVAELVTRGLVRKAADPSDQRSILLKLSRAGRRTYDQIYQIGAERNARWLMALTPEQRKVFLVCLDRLDLETRKLAAKSLGKRSEAPRGARIARHAGTASALPRTRVRRQRLAEQQEGVKP